MRRFVVVAALIASSALARADLIGPALDAVGGGGGGGSGSGSGSGSDQVANDLIDWAGEPQVTALPALLQVAVRQAPALQNARYDIAIADAQISETWIRHDWTIQAQANGAKTLSAFDGLAVSSDQYGGTLDFTRLLPTGGTIDLHGGISYSNDTFGPLGSQTLWQDLVTGGITQPLLKGRGEWLYDANEKKAKLSRDSAVLARRLAAITTVENVVSSYWDLVLAERQVAITEQSLALARERLRVTQIGADAGKTAHSEIPAVEQIIATREEDVLTGELAVLQASIALRRATGLPIGRGELGLRVDSTLDIKEGTWDLGGLVERAFAASPELAQLADQKASTTVDIDVTENALLPQLDAALTIGPTGAEGSFDATAKDLAELKSVSIVGSLTFSRSIGQHDVKGRARELRTQREKIAVNAFDLRARLAQTMTTAVAQLELAQRRVVLSQRAIELAKENIRIETDRFNLGTRTNFDVLNRLEDLRQAELREAQAMVDWHKAEVVVQSLTGDLLPAFGITVD